MSLSSPSQPLRPSSSLKNKNRPKHLNLFVMHFPAAAIISIAHRISGVLLLALIPCMLYLLQYSLTADGYAQLQTVFASFAVKFLVWCFLLPLLLHILAGIRHLLMDVHIGTSKQGGRIGAYSVWVSWVILAILTGIWLW